LAKLDRILQGMDLLDILLVREIDKETDHSNGIARADHRSGQGMSSRAVIASPGVLIFIDDLHPHESLAGARQRDRHRARIEVDDRERIQGIAIGPDDALLGRRGKLAAMPESAETSVFDHAGE